MNELDISSLRVAFECVAENLSRGSSLDRALARAIEQVPTRQTDVPYEI
jgi:hypothetical protein